MGNTSEGARRAAQTIKKRYGAGFFGEIGRKGGKVKPIRKRRLRAVEGK